MPSKVEFFNLSNRDRPQEHDAHEGPEEAQEESKVY